MAKRYDGSSSSIPSSTAPSTDDESFFLEDHHDVLEQQQHDDTAASFSLDEDLESDVVGGHVYHNNGMEGLDRAFTFDCSIEDLPGAGCECEEDTGEAIDGSCSLDFYDDRTVDSLILTRRRFAKNRQEKEAARALSSSPDIEVLATDRKRPCLKMMRRRSYSAGDTTDTTVPLALLETRERLVQFGQDSQRRRRVVQKRDSLELTRKRNPAMVHVWQDVGDDRDAMEDAPAVAGTPSHQTNEDLPRVRPVNRLMRTADSLELARERLPHLIHTRNLDPSEDFLDDLEDDELSLPDDDHHWLNYKWDDDDVSYHDSDSELDNDEWDSDFDPFEDDLDSILVTKKRLAKQKKQSTREEEEKYSDSKQSKDDHPRYKDMHYGRMGLCTTLLQSSRPNSGEANCAA